MDFKYVSTIFDTLYFDVNGYALSNQARDRLHYYERSHTYGEVTAETMHRILKELEPNDGKIFYDLGSGTGKAVILASMLANFKKCIGIELLEELVEAANSVLSRYKVEFEPHYDEKRQQDHIQFIHGDITQFDFSDADVIFIHSTCFYNDIMFPLEKRMAYLKEGTYIVTVSKPLLAPYFALHKSKEYNLGWGKATIYIYRKV